MNLIKYKFVYFAISLIILIPGIFSLVKYGLNLSIDFTGGSILEIQSKRILNEKDLLTLKEQFKKSNVAVASVQKTGDGGYLFRTPPIDTQIKDKIMGNIRSRFGPTIENRFETVGPVIGKELAIKSIQAIIVASLAIVAYIAYAFKSIPKPYASWKFGVAAVIALIHDALVVLGVFSLLGHYFGVQIDSLFVTAILTVIGFSVHDTIVVFDRIRENLLKSSTNVSFEAVANQSLTETLGRSLTTSLTVLFTLFALILFGGESIKWFVIALFIGVISGTYSSVFNAAPLLVIWEEKRSK